MLTIEKLIDLEQERARAWIRRDKETIRNQLHDNSLEINIYGRFSKQEILEELFPQVEMLKFQMSDHQLINTNTGSCGVNYFVDEQIRSQGEVLSFKCIVTAIYKQEGDEWLLLLWHITALKEDLTQKALQS